MPAVTFFTFLNEAYRLDAQEKLSLMNVTAYPKLDESGRDNLVGSYTRTAQSPLELIDELTYTDYSGIKKLGEELGRKF